VFIPIRNTIIKVSSKVEENWMSEDKENKNLSQNGTKDQKQHHTSIAKTTTTTKPSHVCGS